MRKELSPYEKLLYPAFVILGAFLIFAVTRQTPCDNETILFIIIFAALTFPLYFREYALWILDPVTKKKKGSATRWIMDDIPVFAAIFLKGVGVAALVIALASLCFQIFLLADALWVRIKAPLKFRERIGKIKAFPLGQVLFGFTSPFNKITTTVPAGMIYEKLNHGSALLSSWDNIIAVAAMLVVYFTIGTFINAITIALREQIRISKLGLIWWDYYREIIGPILTLGPLGLLFALIYQKAPYALVLIAVPLIAMHQGLKKREEIVENLRHFIISLAQAIEARDHYTKGHSDRVARYSRRIAEEMRLSPQETDDIYRAGRIHDLGKIDIPDAILRKKGRLDDMEFDVMKGHTRVLKVLFDDKKKLSERIRFDLAYSHHERYDGKGYIFGMKGEDIPLGARILSVADTFDALTTDRPYRKGMDPERAMECILQESGTQLDPGVVEAFRRLFDKGEIHKLMEHKEEGFN